MVFFFFCSGCDVLLQQFDCSQWGHPLQRLLTASDNPLQKVKGLQAWLGLAWFDCIGREVSLNAFSLYSNLLGQEFLFLPLMSFYFFVFFLVRFMDGMAPLQRLFIAHQWLSRIRIFIDFLKYPDQAKVFTDQFVHTSMNKAEEFYDVSCEIQ